MNIGPFVIQIIYELGEKSLKLSGFSIRIAWNLKEPRSLHTGWKRYKATKKKHKKD